MAEFMLASPLLTYIRVGRIVTSRTGKGILGWIISG
jgi:hypothetical protein